MDVIGNKIVIAQTNPPISKTNINKEVFATYLEKEGGKARTIRVSREDNRIHERF